MMNLYETILAALKALGGSYVPESELLVKVQESMPHVKHIGEALMDLEACEEVKLSVDLKWSLL